MTKASNIKERPFIVTREDARMAHPSSMDVTICDATAFEYWRVPPIVRLLIAGDLDDSPLRRAIPPGELEAWRSRAGRELALCRRFLTPSPQTRGSGKSVETLRPVIPLMATAHDGPIDIMVSRHSLCHASSLIRPHLYDVDHLHNALKRITHCVEIVSPEVSLLQMSAKASLVRVAMLASELCGSFSLYEPPPLIRKLLQRMQDRTGIPKVGGWRPCLDAKGDLTGLWMRPALASRASLLELAETAAPRKGSAQLAKAVGLICEGAASPFEAQAGILLGFPRKLGGEGYAGFTFNKKVELTRNARLLAGRVHCYCDLYWEEGLDLECQSSLVHQSEGSFLSDSDRTSALRHMGIDVLPVTFGQLADAERFCALSKTVGKMLGIAWHKKTPRQEETARSLRREVLANWVELPRF